MLRGFGGVAFPNHASGFLNSGSFKCCFPLWPFPPEPPRQAGGWCATTCVCVPCAGTPHVPRVPRAAAEGPRDNLVSAPAILTSALGSTVPVFPAHGKLPFEADRPRALAEAGCAYMYSELLKVVAKGKKGRGAAAECGRVVVTSTGDKLAPAFPSPPENLAACLMLGEESHQPPGREWRTCWLPGPAVTVQSPGASNNTLLHPPSSEARGPGRRCQQSWFLPSLP